MHNMNMSDTSDAHSRSSGSISACLGKIFMVAAALLVLVPAAAAQQYPPEAVPPPLNVIDKKDKDSLSSLTGVKERTKLALELMDHRLAAAEQRFNASEYDKMFTELGMFQGILDDTLDFLKMSDNDSRRVLNNFKRFEMGLRDFLPRIGTIRRELPFRYEVYVTHLIEYVRDARTKALEPMFGDNVVRQPRVS